MRNWMMILVSVVAVGCGLKNGDEPSDDGRSYPDGGIVIEVDEIHAGTVIVDTQNVDTNNVDEQNVDSQHVDEQQVDNSNVDKQHVDEQNVDEQNIADAGTPDEGSEDASSDAGPSDPECGDGTCDEGEDHTSCSDDCAAPAPTFLPAPFVVNGKYAFGVSTRYIAGSPCGALRVYYGPMNNVELVDRDATTGEYDGYLSTSMSGLAVSEYRMTYVDSACAGEVRETESIPALYGGIVDLIQMTDEARSFIDCTWYDASADKCVHASDPKCEIRFHVDSDGDIAPAGNVEGLNAGSKCCWASTQDASCN